MHSPLSWIPDLAGTSGPIYERIAEALVRDIRSGRLQPGDQLPPNRELSTALGVTVGTVSRAFGEVLRANLIETGARRGTRVREQLPAEPAGGLRPAPPLPGATRRQVDLRGHQAALRTWGEDIGAVLAGLPGATDLGELLRYDDAGGRMPHRQAGARWLEATGGPAVDPARVVVTDGAQHALLCSLLAVCKAGDAVATERLTYTGLRTLAPFLGLQLVPVDTDEHGLLTSSLRNAMATHDIKALVCVPNIHNPTTALLPAGRREELAELARKTGLYIVEDDVYGGLVEQPLPTISSMAPDQTIRTCSFSKSLGPGLRVGYMETPRRLTATVVEAVRATTWMASPVSAEVATRLVLSGRAQEVMAANRAELALRNAALQRELRGWNLRTSAWSPHAWLELPAPWSTSQFCAWADAAGYKLLGADTFGAARDVADHAVRISVSAAADVAELARFGTLAAQAFAGGAQPVEDQMFP